jgi:hypothetical protein
MEDRKRITNAELTRAYQKVFNGEEGEIVLTDILNQLGYFGNIPQGMNPDLLAVANIILVRLNVFDSSNVQRFVSAMIDSAVAPKEEDDNDF